MKHLLPAIVLAASVQVAAATEAIPPRANALIEDLPAEVVMADAAYDSDRIRDKIRDEGAKAVIPSNPSRSIKHPIDKHLSAQRHLIECCFSKLKQFSPHRNPVRENCTELPVHDRPRRNRPMA